MKFFKNPIDINLRRVLLLAECCFQLQNYCINEREKGFISEIPNEVFRDHFASFEVYLDELDNGGNQ